jgi:excisionase family DNA binding protein
MTENKFNLFLKVSEAADKLGVSSETVLRYTHLKNNPLPVFRLGQHTIRISLEQLEDWLLRKGMEETIKEEGPEHYE